MKIRPAKPTDAPDIQVLWNRSIRETLITFNSIKKTLEEVETAIQNEDAFLVAVDGAQLLGYASFAPFRGGVGYSHTKEHSIMLAQEARGHGVGRALMDALEDEARQQGVHSLIAGVSGSNPMGEPFHAALGFKTVGIVPESGRKFDQWHDLVLMQKFL